MDGLDCLGCDDLIGDGLISNILQGAGGLMQGVANEQEQEGIEKQKKQKVQVAISADSDATMAAAMADLTAQSKSPAAVSAHQTMVQKSMAQSVAGVGLDDTQQQQRIDAAAKALDSAKKSSAANPKDAMQAALAKEWQNTLDKLQARVDATNQAAGQESWFTRRVLGPLPGYAVLVGAGILAVVAKNVIGHRR